MISPTKNSIPKLVIVTLFVAWMIPGILGRDLWKADEPYSFGLVDHIVETGDMVVPSLAGEPFLEKPPIFYITAATFVRLASPWLEPHNAARLASFFFMALTVLFLGLTARELQGGGYGGIAAVLLIGSTGLQITAHKLITDVALLCGFSMAFYGLVLARRRFVLAGLWLGIGTGIGFLSKGLLAPGIIGVVAVILPLFPEWRKKSYLYTLLVAFAAALPWLIVWPYTLYRRSPFLFTEWFWYQNLGRFLGFAHVGRRFSSASYLTILPWFALPALPLAAGTLWAHRSSWRAFPPAVLFPLIVFVVMFLVLSLSSSIRDLYALPMLLPLSLLAAAGADVLRDRTKIAFHTFNVVFFGLVSLGLWIGWIVLISGSPASAAVKLRTLQPGYTPAVNAYLAIAACAYTLAWGYVIVRISRGGSHPALSWTTGMTLVWALLMTIWLPWLDVGTGYRSIFVSLREALPAEHGVIASEGVGESERAMLEYYAGFVTERVEVHRDASNADLFLIESGGTPQEPPAGIKWQLLWEQRRMSGDRPKEIFRLYQRVDGKVNGRAASVAPAGKGGVS